MNFSGQSVFIGAREEMSTSDARWTAWSWTVDDDGVHEHQLTPVRSYAEAEDLVGSIGAERLFVPAEVFADMVRSGAGPS